MNTLGATSHGLRLAADAAGPRTPGLEAGYEPGALFVAVLGALQAPVTSDDAPSLDPERPAGSRREDGPEGHGRDAPSEIAPPLDLLAAVSAALPPGAAPTRVPVRDSLETLVARALPNPSPATGRAAPVPDLSESTTTDIPHATVLTDPADPALPMLLAVEDKALVPAGASAPASEARTRATILRRETHFAPVLPRILTAPKAEVTPPASTPNGVAREAASPLPGTAALGAPAVPMPPEDARPLSAPAPGRIDAAASTAPLAVDPPVADAPSNAAPWPQADLGFVVAGKAVVDGPPAARGASLSEPASGSLALRQPASGTPSPLLSDMALETSAPAHAGLSDVAIVSPARPRLDAASRTQISDPATASTPSQAGRSAAPLQSPLAATVPAMSAPVGRFGPDASTRPMPGEAMSPARIVLPIANRSAAVADSETAPESPTSVLAPDARAGSIGGFVGPTVESVPGQLQTQPGQAARPAPAFPADEPVRPVLAPTRRSEAAIGAAPATVAMPSERAPSVVQERADPPISAEPTPATGPSVVASQPIPRPVTARLDTVPASAEPGIGTTGEPVPRVLSSLGVRPVPPVADAPSPMQGPVAPPDRANLVSEPERASGAPDPAVAKPVDLHPQTVPASDLHRGRPSAHAFTAPALPAGSAVPTMWPAGEPPRPIAPASLLGPTAPAMDDAQAGERPPLPPQAVEMAQPVVAAASVAAARPVFTAPDLACPVQSDGARDAAVTRPPPGGVTSLSVAAPSLAATDGPAPIMIRGSLPPDAIRESERASPPADAFVTPPRVDSGSAPPDPAMANLAAPVRAQDAAVTVSVPITLSLRAGPHPQGSPLESRLDPAARQPEARPGAGPATATGISPSELAQPTEPASTGPAPVGLASAGPADLGTPGAQPGLSLPGAPPQALSGPPAQQVAAAILGQMPRATFGGVPGAPGIEGPLRLLTLQLHPADLGIVLVRMRLRDGQLEMSLHASREETATLLREGGEVLADLLRQGGYQPERVTVVSGPLPGAAAEGQAFPAPSEAGANPDHATPDQPDRRQPDGRAAAPDTSERTHESVSSSPDRSGVYL